VAPKIFLTGATGYIGGSVLTGIVTAHPEYNVTVLLRTVPTGFEKQFPNVTIVNGSFDSTDVLESTAAASDIVIHCGDSDYFPAVSSLLKGMSSRSEPGHYIHLSGTGSISDVYSGEFYGIPNPRVWSDIDDIEEIISLPDDRLHRPVDRYVQEEGEKGKVKTTIICPPDVFGLGTGPGKKQSFLVPLYIGDIVKKDFAFYVGSGMNRRSWVWIHDLVDQYVKVVEDVVDNGGKNMTWGREGLYFSSSPECLIAQRDLAVAVGKILHTRGILKRAEPGELSVQEMLDLTGGTRMALYMYGSNSRGKADRAKIQLGYTPKGGVQEFWASLESDVVAGLENVERSWEAVPVTTT